MQDPFYVVETVCVAWFSVEFLLRLVASPSKRQFGLDVMNLFDVLAIVPYFVVLVPYRAVRTAPYRVVLEPYILYIFAPYVRRLVAPYHSAVFAPYVVVHGPYFLLLSPYLVVLVPTSSPSSCLHILCCARRPADGRQL